MTFKTKSGSIYEVDHEGRRIRRVDGPRPPTSRMGEGWRAFDAISDVSVGAAVIVYWPAYVPLLAGSSAGSAPATVTSVVVEVSK